MPDNPYEPVYAIVIIFVILLFSVTACVGLRVFRKTRFLEQQRQQQQEEEGRPVNDIQLVRIAEAADDETIKTVTSKREGIHCNNKHLTVHLNRLATEISTKYDSIHRCKE